MRALAGVVAGIVARVTLLLPLIRLIDGAAAGGLTRRVRESLNLLPRCFLPGTVCRARTTPAALVANSLCAAVGSERTTRHLAPSPSPPPSSPSFTLQRVFFALGFTPKYPLITEKFEWLLRRRVKESSVLAARLD